MESISIEIVEKIKSGDKLAFKHLYENYYADLCRFGLIYVKDRDIAENIVQDFFVQFWIKRESITINSSIHSYMFSSIRNRSLNYIRDNKKIVNIDENIEMIDSAITFPDYQNEIDYVNLKSAVKEAIEKLPPKCKTIFQLSREENLTYKQIAHNLNISPKTVENQIGIALKKLHDELKPYLELLILLVTLITSYF
jgi:RNA polymerase sigma-70 factor, ECF subfamily